MALVRAKRDVYLGNHGYRTEGEEFEYTGPANHNLEAADSSTANLDDNDTKYHALTRDELKAELNKRCVSFAPNAQDKTLRGLLETDDESN